MSFRSRIEDFRSLTRNTRFVVKNRLSYMKNLDCRRKQHTPSVIYFSVCYSVCYLRLRVLLRRVVLGGYLLRARPLSEGKLHWDPFLFYSKGGGAGNRKVQHVHDVQQTSAE